MNNTKQTKWILTAFLMGILSAGIVGAGESPTDAEQVAGLVKMCADTEQARVQRQMEKPLYYRLGEYDKIYEMTAEIVRLHNINPDFQRFMGDVDSEKLTKNVADFVSTGTGGPKVYTGRDMPSAHAHLTLSNADFLSAGSDVATGMQNMGYGEDEIQEFLCILVSMKDLVITR